MCGVFTVVPFSQLSVDTVEKTSNFLHAFLFMHIHLEHTLISEMN